MDWCPIRGWGVGVNVCHPLSTTETREKHRPYIRLYGSEKDLFILELVFLSRFLLKTVIRNWEKITANQEITHRIMNFYFWCHKSPGIVLFKKAL